MRGRFASAPSRPEALASAIRAIVAVDRRCSPSDVGIAVLGAPPDGFVVPWSEATVGGFALERTMGRVVGQYAVGPFGIVHQKIDVTDSAAIDSNCPGSTPR